MAKEDHSDADCLVVLVMTHGRSGELHAYDVIYKEKRLWEAFAGDKCPSLLGKPKLFFIQVNRLEGLLKCIFLFLGWKPPYLARKFSRTFSLSFPLSFPLLVQKLLLFFFRLAEETKQMKDLNYVLY